MIQLSVQPASLFCNYQKVKRRRSAIYRCCFLRCFVCIVGICRCQFGSAKSYLSGSRAGVKEWAAGEEERKGDDKVRMVTLFPFLSKIHNTNMLLSYKIFQMRISFTAESFVAPSWIIQNVIISTSS